MPLFTKENAAILGKKGAQARWSQPEPEPLADSAKPIIPPIPAKMADPHVVNRLKRVRRHLNALDDLADKLLSEEGHFCPECKRHAPDTSGIERLARASASWSETEQRLAGRPNLAPVKAEPGRRNGPTLGEIESLL